MNTLKLVNKISIALLLLIFTQASNAGDKVFTYGDSKSYRMSESLSKSTARVDAKEIARERCPNGLKSNTIKYSNWKTYGRKATSNSKAEREGYRHSVRLDAECK